MPPPTDTRTDRDREYEDLAAWLRRTPAPMPPLWLAPGMPVEDTFRFWGWALASLDAGVRGRQREALLWLLSRARQAVEARDGL